MAVMPRRTLSKQSVRGQVSVRLTPEICINKVSSNSRLTAAGKWATASDSHSQNCLQALYFSLFLWGDNNGPTPASWKTYWNFMAFELGTICGFSFFVCYFALFCVFGFFPLLWDNDRTTSETPSPGSEAKGLTPKLLRLKLYCVWTWRIFSFIYDLFFFQSSLCLSNTCSAYCWLVHYLSLFIPLKLFFVSLFCFFYLFVNLFFPISLTSLLSISSHPSILNITIVIITS
jgi:hypothetical protein